MQVVKVVVHSVDNNLDTVVLSKRQINLNQNVELDQLVLKFTQGILKSSASFDGILSDNSLLKETDFQFMDSATRLAQEWFDNYEANTKETALNLIFSLVMDEKSSYFTMFEISSKPGFLRTAEAEENNIEYNSSIMNDSLASVKTAFVYDTITQELKVRHTAHTQELLESMLDFETIPNTKKNLEILDAMVDYVSEKREEDITQNAIKSKQLILDSSELFEEVEPIRIIETVFSDLDSEERLFIDETIQESKMSSLIPSNEVAKLSARKKHRIKTESGIELVLPLDSLKLEDMLEVKHNSDGSVDILLKNVGDIH